MKKFFLILVCSLSFAFSLQAAIDIHEFDSPEQEQLFKELGKKLRCPKCQNNNIADSNAPLAQDLRTKVYEMLKEGKTEDDIVNYMVARYGNFVTYSPPLTASTMILWAAPVIFVVIGFIMLFYNSKNKTSKKVVLSDAEQARLAALLNNDQNDGAMK